MPKVTRRSISAPLQISQLAATGGRLAMLRRGSDTLFAMIPSVVAGHVRDSTSGRAIANAVISLEGTSLSAVTGERGAFTLAGALPGAYTLLVRSAALDSLGVTIRRSVVVDAPTVSVTALVPNVRSLAQSMCNAVGSARRTSSSTAIDSAYGGIIGPVRASDSEAALLPEVIVSAEWSSFEPRTLERGVVQLSERYRETVTDPQGIYRLCDLPIDKRIAVRARPLTGRASPVAVTLSVDNPYIALPLRVDK